MIRLQNKGSKNHPYWWIVVQGSYTNLRGRFIEHIGYWIPRKTKTVQRAYILNKPRILYWLAMGAQPSKAVQRMLSHINYMPAPMIPYGGRKYLYEKQERKQEGYHEEYPRSRQLGHYANAYHIVKQREELNLIEREIRAQQEVEKHVKFDTKDFDKVELIESDIEDEDERSRTFYALKSKFAELEKDTKKLSTAKRELLIRKMNKLASQGLKPNIYDLNAPTDLKSKLIDSPDPKTKAEKEIRFAQYIALKQKQYEKAVHDKEMTKPITVEEYANAIVENHNVSYQKAKKWAMHVFDIAGKNNITLTKQDALETGYEGDREVDISELANQDPSEVLIPTRRPITPFPDINAYDPSHYYDTRPGYLSPHDPNKSYVSLSDRMSLPFKIPKLRKKKHITNSTRNRVTFSTLNSPSQQIPLAARDNITFEYSGLMKKISDSITSL